MSDSSVVEFFADIATALVVIGLAFEYLPQLIAYCKKPWYERSRFSFIKVLHVVAPVLVVSGVAGELFFHHRSNALQTAVIKEQQSKIIALDTRANAMVDQLRPRGFDNKEEFDAFVESLRGKFTRKVTIYTLPDPEAAMFGFEIVYAFQQANIPHEWVRLPRNEIFVEGVSSTGLTLLDPGAANGDPIAKAEEDAFLTVLSKVTKGVAASMPPKAPEGITVPALFIGLHPVRFAWMPGFSFKSGMLPSPPWEAK